MKKEHIPQATAEKSTSAAVDTSIHATADGGTFNTGHC